VSILQETARVMKTCNSKAEMQLRKGSKKGNSNVAGSEILVRNYTG
jgi:hypothetical protein